VYSLRNPYNYITLQYLILLQIKELNLAEFFDSIVVSGDLKWEKPEPEIFHRACTNLGVQPFECLIVGDRIDTDIKGGFAAQLGITVWMPIDEPGQELPKPLPDFTIREISQLVGILQRGNEKLKPKGIQRASKGRSSSGAGGAAAGSNFSAAASVGSASGSGTVSLGPTPSSNSPANSQAQHQSTKPASDAED
jgi:N-acylneuraminate-9-phosphatase